ncbi:MAG: hypothetical protein A2600_12250 [Candidatus Lambdaproteobacteria bacterium RIFOXYD1_FULL_56_27]|uniref:ABC transporter domain-containing protein n=1 Tax=Candidatus Lambdaproteobacteria bacterium RIFOXYD2_FULL_56_26 TaxID=1817773 RepID=A0A1F6GTF5_9PROT|nr:MAG: hypothetical protein A2426_12015 [Candidatus Lambdaproteobacteria bacterium RIFOXYC1_FULL_56_13]OGH01280.1 MAG: hypothetical protein A2557_11410 [Candidatus Lambdaproteobacteria bacterium RIFOXYD2_FULL_56_26]OGH06257.1 MAG: hypothetical protein A2600_12250 [Candidatus Lambdaproteobacteria bacterium RIFOXYD1_FULL_56_27]
MDKPLLAVVGLQFLDYQPFSLELYPGEIVGLEGASGAGKSLFLRSLADLDPHRGQVFLEDRGMESFAPWAWRKKVAYLPAESSWWLDLVAEHFTDLDPATLEALGLTPGLAKSPVTALSTGERQRFAFARILQNQPQVFLLDEPTAALDPDNVKRFEGLLAELLAQSGAAVLMTSHDASQLDRLAKRRYKVAHKSLSLR